MLESHRVLSEREMFGPTMAVSTENELVNRRFRNSPAIEARKASIFLKVDPGRFAEFVVDFSKHQQLGDDLSEMLQTVFVENFDKDTGERRYVLSFILAASKMMRKKNEVELSIFLKKFNSEDLIKMITLLNYCSGGGEGFQVSDLRRLLQDCLKAQ